MISRLNRYIVDVMNYKGINLSRLSDDEKQDIARAMANDYVRTIKWIKGLGLSRIGKLELMEKIEDQLEIIKYLVDDNDFVTTDELLEMIQEQKYLSGIYCYYQFLLNCLEFSLI